MTDLIARLRHAVPGHLADLAAAAPRHLLDRGPGAADPRSQDGEPARAGRASSWSPRPASGTVAAGVAKAYADYVLIAGHNGGTGASPLSSIKHAGSPWELGLAEAQATLVRNGLRHRIEVRTDGGLKTGRDVVIAALLGAESYGFGTAPLVAMGCAMARQCHINTCPTGIATQREDLRAKFKGTPEQVIALLHAAGRGGPADSRRHGLPQRWTRSSAATTCCSGSSGRTCRARRCSTCRCCWRRRADAGQRRHAARRTEARNDRPGVVSLDTEILADLEPYLESGLPFSGSYPIHNHHLAVGARVAGAIAERNGDAGLPPGAVRLRFTGSAGQSFGAFTCRGMHLELEGEANDYVGKGLSGGELTIRPFRRAAYADASHQHLIIGNTILYGATAGQAVRRRPGGRPVRGAQLRRGRGDRRRRQPLLRVHDRRHRGRARPRRAGTSGPGCRTAWPTWSTRRAPSRAG